MTEKASKPRLVGVVGSEASAERAIAGLSLMPDLLEVRVDLLLPILQKVMPGLSAIRQPKILTVRDSAEGGAGGLSFEARYSLYERWLPHHQFIDLELANLERFQPLVETARAAGCELIVSRHDLLRTPALSDLERTLDGIDEGAYFKVAARTDSWSDLETLVTFFERRRARRLIVMGMGAFGKLSRALLARLGCPLVYCGLEETVAPGQWQLERFHEFLNEIWE
jgi:3-dehydroquinate dehydratase I